MSRVYDAKQAALAAYPDNEEAGVDLFLMITNADSCTIAFELGMEVEVYIYGDKDQQRERKRMTLEDNIDWDRAESNLKLAERVYTEIGTSGLFAMQFTISPLRDRFNKGERTQKLFDEINNIEL